MSGSSGTAGRLAGKIALVTGACGGIGMAICRRYTQEGATVIGADVAPPTAVDPAVMSACVHLDVVSESSVRGLRDHVAGVHGRLDVMVNNAGAMVGRPLVETSVAEFDRLYEVNLRGPFLVMRELAPLMGDTGSIVNMSSAAAVRNTSGMSAYSGTKAGLVALSRIAAIELAPIRVNSILPGAIDTPMPRAFLANLPDTKQAQALQALGEQRLAKRLGRPEEIADLAVYLASDEAGFVTGSDFVIDGGRA
ncbi:SDR family NAD(P)-dependent oxidoreductase [Arvimicrobium flavum]|uniref:SDR family NAD(P)-dependent oxidoreductase n=1 Tax=Arvimicrobium flavum TaxID=3393320 RepID=UPI00237A9AC9|nr:SDR family oxidoreductase [Mesorhizobium shangrilense]